MPKIGSFQEVLDGYEKNEIIDYHNPTCHNCNECCSMIVMITEEEFQRLKKFLRYDPRGKQIFQRGINIWKKYKQKGTIYFMCPFCNSRKRCDIYSFRPRLCREFHCSPELAPGYDKTIVEIENHRTIYDLWKEAFQA